MTDLLPVDIRGEDREKMENKIQLSAGLNVKRSMP